MKQNEPGCGELLMLVVLLVFVGGHCGLMIGSLLW